MEPNDHTRGKALTRPWRRRNNQSWEVQGSGPGSGNAEATSSNAAPAMFGCTTNPMITGGHFDAHEGDRTSVTININPSRIPRTSGGLAQIRNQPSAHNAAPNSETNHNRNRRRRVPNIPEENIIRPVQRSNEIYERHLMLKGRGFPLWIPQANIHLPIPYRAKGVCIGDVGIVTAFGGFDFLFNICRARDDPINPEALPDNFAPIHPPLSMIDIRKFREFSAGSYLASSSIVKSQTTEQTPGLIFESSASEGAILTMPEGAFQEELGNLSRFRDYVAVHATDWYKFVNGPRGREAQNGDVRVVVGCDKTTSWGMATFSNTSSAQQSKFRLKFHPLGGQQQPQRSGYAWEHSGVAEVRVGPEPGENEELGEIPTCQLQNQCLFMRTLSITLSDSVWAEAFPGTVSAINQEASQPKYRSPSNTNTTTPHSSSSNPAESIQGRRGSPGPSECEVAEEEDNDDEESSTPIQVPWVSPSSSPRRHVGPTDDTHDADDIVPEKRLVPSFVDKLYRIINDESADSITWRYTGEAFIIWNVGRFTGFLESYFLYNNFSRFVYELNMYDFRSSLPYYSAENQSLEFCHPKFKRGRPDLLHEIKRKPFEPNLTMKDEVEFFGDLGHVPAQLGAIQNEDMRMWDSSKIINKYLLAQVSDAKIALTHDRDWSYVAKMGSSYLDPSKLIEEVTFQNDITVDNGIVFLELKSEMSPTVEERVIIDQINGGQITVEQYLFGSSENRSTILHFLTAELRSVYMPFRDRSIMPTTGRGTLMGHPKRLLSLDDLMGIQGEKSLLQPRRIDSVGRELNALPPGHPDKGKCLLRLADALSRRFWQLNQRDDLEEAIWYYDEAVSLLPQTHYHFLEAILGLCSSLYHRFQLLGQLDDLEKLLDSLYVECNLNFESLLSPVKAQLQELPQQLINKLSDPLGNWMTMNEGLNAPSQAIGTKPEPWSWRNQRKTARNSDAKVESPRDAKTTKDSLDLSLWGV